MYLLRMGARNAVKHWRRSAASVAVIAVGFTALALFSGYAANVFRGLREQAVRGEGLGHLTVARSGFFEEGSIHPAKYLFSRDELERVLALIRADPDVRLATPRLGLTGLISNGEISTVFLAEGMVPEDERRLRGEYARGGSSGLVPGRIRGAALASGLSRVLGLGAGKSAVLLTATVDGAANALDLDVVSVFNTGNAATNDKQILVPFAFAQQLLDTGGAERVVVLLDGFDRVPAARERLSATLAAAGLSVEIRAWEELSQFYGQVRRFLKMIFLFIFTIVLVVVLMSVANTMAMAVVERTREIATLRSLGMKRSGIVQLFSEEGGVLATLGCALGLPATFVVALVVNGLGLSYVPPSQSQPVPLRVDLDAAQLASWFLLLGVLATVAALVPALRAARLRIVDGLGHV